MGIESFGNYENPGTNEQKESLNYDLGSLTDSQNRIESEARNYVLREQNRGRDVTDLIQNLTPMIERQRGENESLETQIQSETIERLDKEACINEAKTEIYEKCGISDNQSENSAFENFSKGFVDEMIIGNYDMAIEVINSGGQIIIDALKQLASWEGLKQMAQALGESVWNLFTGDAYERGKAIAELGLVATGVGLGVTLGKKGLKLGMKQISKLRVNKELLVDAPDIRKVVGETRGKVDDIVPKQEVNVEALVKRNIDIERQVGKLEEIGIPESFSRDMLESGLMREKFFGGDLLRRFERLQKKGIDINGKINEVIKDIPSLAREEALLIFSYTDNTIVEKLNGFMRGDKNIIDNMTKENIESSLKLVSSLEEALEKMPDLKGDLILRGDDWKGWLTEGSDIPLKAFTSVSNNKDDIFLGSSRGNNLLVEILGKQGRVKDVSSLAMFVQFANKLGQKPTLNEGIILPNSIVRFISKEDKIHNLDNVDQLITEVTVKQIK